jgi:hypothetical protein
MVAIVWPLLASAQLAVDGTVTLGVRFVKKKIAVSV